MNVSANLSLKIKAEHEELDNLTATVEDLGERENWPPDLVFRVNLVLEEVGLNIMDYGLEHGLGEIEIVFTSDGRSLTIEVIDDGKPFDPLTEAPEPDLDASIEDRRVGGLGIHLVRNMMDEMRYRRENDKNHLTLVAHGIE